MAKKINEELLNDIINTVGSEQLTGYGIYKALKEKYEGLSSRLVYHYLKTALARGDLIVIEKIEHGKFSWGDTVHKKYYNKAKHT
jgi:hypothetical protein